MQPQDTSPDRSPTDPKKSTTMTTTTKQQEKPAMEKTDSIMSAVNSGNSIEALKGRIITTHKLLKYLETSRHDLKEEKNRVKQLETENQQVNQKLTNREMYIQQLEAVADETSKKQQSTSVEFTKLKKELASMKASKESIQTSHRSLQSEHIALKKQINELKKGSARNGESTSSPDTNAALQKKYDTLKEQCEELKKERDEWENKYDALEDDKMELNINYEMLQDSLKEAKQEIATFQNQKKEIDTLRAKVAELSKMQSQKQELVSLRSKVLELQTQIDEERQQHQSMIISERQQRAQSPVARKAAVSPMRNQDHLIGELRKRVVENKKLLEEKRVLQDRYTELLVINSRLTEQQRNTDLAPYIPEFDNVAPSLTQSNNWDDFMDTDSFSTEIPLQQPQQQRTTKAVTSSDMVSTSMTHRSRRVSHPSSSSSSSPPPSISSTSANNVRRAPLLLHSSENVSPTSSSPPSSSSQRIPPEPQEIKKSTTKKTRAPKTKLEKLTGMRLPGISRKRKVDEATIPSTVPSSTTSSNPITATAPKNTTTTTVTPQASASLTTTGTATIPADRPLKKPKVTPLPSLKVLEGYVQKFAKNLPNDSIHELSDMAEQITKLKTHFPKKRGNQHHPLFECVALFYKESRTHANPIMKSEPCTEPQKHCLAENIYLISPVCVDAREKNLALMLFAYCSLYEKTLYPVLVKWATSQVREHLKNSKVSFACRYIRLLSMLYRRNDDKKRINVLCYDLVRLTAIKDNFLFPLMNIAVIWQDILTLSSGVLPDGMGMIMKVIQSACAEFCQSDPKTSHYYKTFMDLCGWPSVKDSTSLSDRLVEFSRVLVSEEYKKLEVLHPVAFGDLRFNLVKAFELAYYRINNWETTYDDFIVKELWPLMSNQYIADTCLELMALLVRIGSTPSSLDPSLRRSRLAPKESEHPGATAIRTKLIEALHVTERCSEDDFMLQITTAKGLLLLSNQQLSHAMPVIIWYQNMEDRFRQLLPVELNSNINLLATYLKGAISV